MQHLDSKFKQQVETNQHMQQLKRELQPNMKLITSKLNYLPAPTTTIFCFKKSANGRPWALTVPNNPASATPAVPYNKQINAKPFDFNSMLYLNPLKNKR